MVYKHAQIKMFETIAVLIIFFILLAAGFAFYSNFERYSLQNEQLREESKSAIEIAQRAALVPEFICSREVVIENCFDLYKIQVFADTLNQSSTSERMYYFHIFGLSNITLTVYPLREYNRSSYELPSSGQTFSLYENIPAQFTSKSVLFYPIVVYEPIYSINHFGILQIEVYQ